MKRESEPGSFEIDLARNTSEVEELWEQTYAIMCNALALESVPQSTIAIAMFRVACRKCAQDPGCAKP